MELEKLQPDVLYTVRSERENSEIKIKGSRFIGHIIHTPNREAAETEYKSICKKYYDATHNCFAYRIDKDTFRYSDDGEPSGTAGLPILKVLESKQLQQTLLVVTRYFGGTKLGTGGLARAYSDAALAAVEATKIKLLVLYVDYLVECSYDVLKNLEFVVNNYGGQIAESDYREKVMLKIKIPVSKQGKFLVEIKYRFYSNKKIVIRKSDT